MDDPKAVVSNYWALMSDGKIDDAFALLDEDVNWWVLGFGDFKGKAKFRESNEWFLSLLTDDGAKFTPGRMIAEGDTVALTMESRALTKTGRKYENNYALMFEVRDGLIVSAREYHDTRHAWDALEVDSGAAAGGS
jgi:ketosteroid isomerase-like protein